MKSLIYKPLLAILAIMVISSFSFHTSAQKGVDVQYDETNIYFVHQNAKKGTLKLVIKNKKEFDDVFGCAMTGGYIPPIDFDRYFMIALVVPHEIAQVRVNPVSLKRDGKKLYFYYSIDMKDRTGVSNRSYAAVLVDRKELSKVEFKEVSSSNDLIPSEPIGDKSLRDQLKYVTAENEQLKKQVAQLEADVDQLRQKISNANQLIYRLKQENEDMKKILGRH